MRPILCASILALCGVSVAQADIGAVPGLYQASFPVGACTLQLNEPSRTPEYSRVEAETVSGFAIGFPNCAHGLDGAAMWQADAAGQTLSLIDASGAIVFSGTLSERRTYTGQTASGVTITIARS